MPDKGGEAAFPYCVWNGDDHAGHINGLTKREYFAAKAMEGMLANPTGKVNYGYKGKHEDAIAEAAVVLADALLAALESKANGNEE